MLAVWQRHHPWRCLSRALQVVESARYVVENVFCSRHVALMRAMQVVAVLSSQTGLFIPQPKSQTSQLPELTARSVSYDCSWFLRKLALFFVMPVALVVAIALCTYSSSCLCVCAYFVLNFPALCSSVAIWLPLAAIWIPCWFCNYKDRYVEDNRDFFDYVLACLKLQLQVLIGLPFALACES